MWLFEGAEGGKWLEEVEKKYSESQLRPSAAAEVVSDGHDTGDTAQMSKKQRTK